VAIVPTRAAGLVAESLESQVCIVAASAGWGKTTAAHAALEGRNHRWIDAAAAPDEPGRLLWQLARAFGWPLEPKTSARAAAQRIPADTGILAIDDAHELRADPASMQLLRTIVEERPDVRVMLIGREHLPLPFATWIAAGIAALPVTEDDLAIEAGELRALLRLSGVRDDDATVAAVLRFTHGWAVAVRFALMALRRSPDLTRVERIGRDLAFAYLAEQIVGALDAAHRDLLEHLAFAGAFDEDTIASLGVASPHEMMEWIAHAGLPLHRSPAQVRLHDVFVGFLIAQMSPQARAERASRVAAVLTARGGIGETLDLLRVHAPGELCAFLERHGLALLQSGRRNSVRRAIAGLPIRSRRENPAIVMLRAWVEHGNGNFSRATALADRALEKADRQSPGYAELLRLRAILKLYEPRDDARRWIERAIVSASAEEMNELRGPYAIHLAINGTIPDALAQMRAVIADAERSDLTPALARAYTWAMTVFAYAGDYDAVADFGRKAAAIHQRTQDLKGIVIVHNTLALAGHMLRDDRAETLRQVRAYVDAAAAWGDPVSVKQSTAFLYQLAVERGDDAEAERLEPRISASDVSFGGILWYRFARALRRGWAGDFAGALAFLDGLGEHLTNPVEARCRYALAALFAAAGGDPAAQSYLEQAALDPPGPQPESAVTQRLRRLGAIYAGFAAIYLGRGASARKYFAGPVRADEQALAAAGIQLSQLGARAGPGAVEPLASELERAGQGGVARFVRSAATAFAEAERPRGLTAAEAEVLRDLAAGIVPKQIALQSGRSIETVRNHVKSAIRKLGVSGRLEAVAAARNAGLI